MSNKRIIAALSAKVRAINQILQRIYYRIFDVGRGRLTADDAVHLMIEDYNDLQEIAKTLDRIVGELGTPYPRLNFEVGTVEEQLERFKKWNAKHGCINPPPFAVLNWGTSLYTEQEDDDEE